MVLGENIIGGKFIMTAKDTGIGAADNSASNIEGGSNQQPMVVNLLNNENLNLV